VNFRVKKVYETEPPTYEIEPVEPTGNAALEAGATISVTVETEGCESR
jgi:hypothetical protein